MTPVPESTGCTETRRLRRAGARRLRGIAIAWLLVVAGATAAGTLGDILDLADHSCCPKSAVRASLPAAPCQALLPLACCDGTTLPAVAPAAPDRSDISLALIAAAPRMAPLGPGPLDLRRTLASSPRSSPLSLSVILRI